LLPVLVSLLSVPALQPSVGAEHQLQEDEGEEEDRSLVFFAVLPCLYY
jgi:hypothetical protein